MKKWVVRLICALMIVTSLGVQSISAESTINVRVEQMLSQMTLEQKVGQMLQPDTRSITPQQVKENYIGSILSGGGASPTTGNTAIDWANRLDSYQEAAITGFGIPLLYGVDAVHGHNNVVGATIFPHNIGLGQADDIDLMKRIAIATAKEMRATGAHWTFTPTLGLPKNERWGRTYETFGEDAHLAARLGAAYIEASQGNLESVSAIATAKHFIGEGLATNGANQGDIPWAYDSAEFQEILETELLVPYRAAIEKDVKSIMVTYNSINGVKAHGSRELINDLLKEELAFEGIVISDYNGIDQIEGGLTYQQQAIKGVNAGIDMLMVDGYEGNTPKWLLLKNAIIAGVTNGEIPVERIDDAVRRILTVKFELGFIDDVSLSYADRSLLDTVGSDAHREIAREAVRKSLVLLKNSETQNGDSTIMLDLQDMEKIVVAGSAADDIGMQCGGWTISWQGGTGNVTNGTTIFSGLKEVAGDNVTIDYNANGYFTDTDYEAAIVVLGETPYAEGDGDRTAGELKLRSEDVQVINRIKRDHPNLPIIAVLTIGRPLTIVDEVDHLDAIIMAGLPGSEGAGVADVLLGNYDFTGNLTITWPWYAQDIESKFDDPSKVMFPYGRGLSKSQTTPIETEAPIDPSIVDLEETNGILEAEAFISKHPNIQLENNGTSIGYFWDGYDVVYRVRVPETARYTLTLHAATANDNIDAAIDIYVDGKLFYRNSTPLPNTGGWANFRALEMTDKISLPEGVHELKIVSRSRDFNVDKFVFTRYDSDYEEPVVIEEQENIGTGALIKEGAVEVSVSSSDNSQSMSWYAGDQEITYKNEKQSSLDIRNVDTSDMTTIVIDDTKEHQSLLGMGMSVEESTVNNMMRMSPETRKQLITQLLDPHTGMGNTFFRLTIGTSDFTGQEFYTYYDGKGNELNGNPDWHNITGAGFSIQKDHEYGIIQVIQEIQEIAKELGVDDELKFFASPWTPPGWMKTPTNASNSYPNNDLLLKGGRLSDAHIQDLAKYFVRFIEEYHMLGIPMHAITLQNEPLLEINYPSCYMTATQQAYLAEAVKKELAASSILTTEAKDVKVWAFDHNFDGAENYVAELFATASGRDNVDGIAFHPYGGVPSTMGNIYEEYKDQYSMHLTERSVWGASGANDIIDWFRNGSESYNGWVTMLDSNIAPHQWVGTPDPTLFVQDANNRERYWATPEVYILGQFSKYIRPGYVRIDSNNGSSATVTNVAFKDPETGKIVLVVVNRNSDKQNFKVVLDGTQFNATIEGGNVATYMWNPIDRTNFKEITDTLTVNDATIGGSGVIQGDELGYIDHTTVLDYYVNVKDPGTYRVLFEVAPGGDWDVNFPIVVSQGDETLGQAHVMRYVWWGEEWSSYTKVQTYVTFAEAGLQSFRITFPQGGMNFKGVQFIKDNEIQSIPGILHTDNYFDNYGLIKEEGDISNFGFIIADNYVDYKVDVQKTDTYEMVFTAATNTNNSGAIILSIDEEGNETIIGDVSFNNTGSLDTYEEHRVSYTLTEGEQTLRITFTDGDTNFRNVVIGQAITIIQDDIIEGELTGASFEVELHNGVFNTTLDVNNWNIQLPRGVTYTLERLSDTRVKVTLLSEATIDFDIDQLIVCEIDAEEYNGIPDTSVIAYVRITAIDDDEELIVENPVAFNQETIDIQIVGGTFREEVIDNIALIGNAARYVFISDVTYIDHLTIRVHLSWQVMYGDFEGTITINSDGYDDGQLPLTVDTIFKGTSEAPSAIPITNESVILSEDLAYRNIGSLKINPQRGDYLDFYLDIKEEGDYVLKYQVHTSQSINNALKLSGGPGFATDNLMSISFGRFWDNTVEYRHALRLQPGEQTLRFEMNTAGFILEEIVIEKHAGPIIVDEETTITVDDLIDGSKTRGWAIEQKQGLFNIGNSEAGSYQDYLVDIQQGGVYNFSINAGGNSGNVPEAALQSVVNGNETEVGRLQIPNTGDWDTFVDSDVVEVRLPKGTQILRIYNDVDGFNYRSYTLSLLYTDDTTKPVITGNNAMVYKNTTASIYDILNLQVIDDVDGDITFDIDKVTIETDYNPAKVGTYTVKVIAIDEANNREEKEFTITVVNVATISYNDAPILVGSSFDPFHETTVFDVDGSDITDKTIVISNTVDTSKVGTYEVVYEVVDALGTTVRFTRNVVVQENITEEKDPDGQIVVDEVIQDGKPEQQIITPPTGDNTNVVPFILLLAIAGLASIIVGKKKRKS